MQNVLDFDIYTEKNGRCVKGECVSRSIIRILRIFINRKAIGSIEEVWKKK